MKPAIVLIAAMLAAPVAAQQPQGEPAPVVAPSDRLDPEAAAAAERLVALFIPEGSMRRMFGAALPEFDAVLDMPLADFPDIDSGAEGGGPHRTLAEAMEARDPHFRERMRITQQVVNETLAEAIAESEPEFRRAMAELYARRFTTAELNEMIGFFLTPTGRKFAEMALTMTQDPAFARMTQAMTSRMAAAAPGLVERIAAATAHLPAPPADSQSE